MSDNAAALLALAIMLNGCFQMPKSINEHALIDEYELGTAMTEAACYLSGREWHYTECREASQ